MFSRNEPDIKIESAFEQGQAFLFHLSANSPLAKRYFEILSSLRSAIRSHHEQLRSGKKTLVSKIFSIENGGETSTPLAGSTRAGAQFQQFSTNWQEYPDVDVPPNGIDPFSTFDFPFDSFDSVKMNLWDNFVYWPEFQRGS